jgi:hypothetical protein
MLDQKSINEGASRLEAYTLDLARYTKWLMFATVLSAIASVLSMICTGWMAWYTKDLRNFAAQQAKDMTQTIELTLKSIETANRQAAAAEKANEAVAAVAERQLRAYLTMERHDTYRSVSVNGITSPTKFMFMGWSMKNVGQTPAYKVTSYKEEAIIDHQPTGVVLTAPGEYQRAGQK